MKRIAVLVLLVAIVIVVTLSFAQSLTEIKKRGKLIVGTEPTFPPLSSLTRKTKLLVLI